MAESRFFYVSIFFLFQSAFVFGQDTKIEIPISNDKCSGYVKQLENDKTDIDYADFRNSFLESRQFAKKGRNYDSLKKQVYTEIQRKNHKEIIRIAKNMLSLDYTSLFAHKYLQQTYKFFDDTLSMHKYHDIEFGLLYSIIRSGDGKTCETGWHVTQ